MANIADLVVSLSADIAQFRSGMQEANGSLKDLNSQFDTAREAARSFIETIGGFLAAHEIVGFLEDSAAATRSWAEQLSTFQGIAGLSSTAAATLAASTQIAGVSADVVTQAMSRLGVAIATHPQKFQELGIAIRDASGNLLPMTDIMRNTIAGLDQFKAGTDRATAAGYLFGRGAEAWITQLDKLGPQLQAGNWAQNAELVKGLGLSMEDSKASAAAWAQAEGTLKLELLGVENQIGQALLPAIQGLGTAIANYAKNGDLKAWAEDAARAILGLTIGLAEMTDFVASHNQVFGTILAVAGGSAFLESGSVAGLAAFTAGWKMTGTGASEAADKVHAATLKMIADLKSAQEQIGKTQPGAPAAGGAPPPDGTKTFNLPSPQEKQLNDSIATLTANYQRQIDENAQLTAAMATSKDAAKALSDQFSAEDKILAIRAQAMRDGITLTDAQTASLEALALKEGASKDILQEATQVRANLDAAMKKQSDDMLKLVASADLLTPKEQELADRAGLLWQALDRGLISMQQFNDAMKELNQQLAGPDKGMKEFTSGLSADFDTLIGKATDFTEIMANEQKGKGKKGESLFFQLSQDADQFAASLEKLLVKLLVINPLLNSLGLGDQGSGKQLPTLWGGSGNALLSGGAPGGGASPASGGMGGMLGGALGLFGKLFGFSGSTAAPAAAAAPVTDDEIAAALQSSVSMGAFAEGGDFTVDGSGGTDSKRVSFLATPGERVSVAPEARAKPADSDESRGRGDININMPISSANSDSFRANRHQITGDMVRAISAGSRRYA